jgi:hypothetical protein
MRIPGLQAACSGAPALLVALAVPGCADTLPDPGLVVGRRLLAVRTEVVEALVPEQGPTPRAQALPFETVRIEPFVVGPSGPVELAGLDAVWIACQNPPSVPLLGCIQAAMPIALAELPACPEPDPSDLDGEELPAPPSPCVIGRAGAVDYVVPMSANVLVGGDVELTMIAGDADVTTDDCARRFLADDAQLPDGCLLGVQRLTLGPLTYLAFVADQAGFAIPGVEVPEPDQVTQPDRHPRIAALRVGLEQEDEALPEIGPGDVVTAAIEARLRVEISQPEEDLQTYPIAVDDAGNAEERREAHEGRWFRTWGRLSSGSSDDPESFVEWELVPGVQDQAETPDDARAFVYYVVRDGRQGVAWTWFELAVEAG